MKSHEFIPALDELENRALLNGGTISAEVATLEQHSTATPRVDYGAETSVDASRAEHAVNLMETLGYSPLTGNPITTTSADVPLPESSIPSEGKIFLGSSLVIGSALVLNYLAGNRHHHIDRAVTADSGDEEISQTVSMDSIQKGRASVVGALRRVAASLFSL